MNRDELATLKSELDSEFVKIKSLGLSLDMSRGKPGADQLSLSVDMLNVLSSAEDCKAENGFDCRNYGVLDGIPECKRLFSELLGVDAKNIIVGGSSSLNLMYDYLSQCMFLGVAGCEPWNKQGKIKFICNVPGYDRHFAITEFMGIEMISVKMQNDGPDVDKISELIKDPAVKGMFCVPKYSNPNGVTYSDEKVKVLASLQPAAKDFRVIWDNAYIIHELTDDPDVLLNIFDACKEYGTEDYFVEFTSTSKISFPGAGVSAIAASDNNIAEIKKRLNFQTISYDKLNQLRHVKYFKNVDGITEHMKKHAAIIAPKFSLVLDMLKKELEPCKIGEWVNAKGGYFISYDALVGSAKRIGELCKEAGVVLTTVGATYPYGVDPEDKNIRIAPTYPSLDELQKAMEVFCLCAKIAALEALLK
ncbi:MAG: aminotransferase class I/II-fold pyridoxal phosphate-dependent enzyme [Oscillospiraceae bacterium]|nr:aminotransferase class I/II-fold pyridoxal phosphate-dependent enzyme [Oscillospiraceae bacterium]